MLTVKTLDGKDVDITHCDAGYSPGSPTKSPILNITAVWYKLDEVWNRSIHRSAMKTADVIKRTHSNDLVSILSDKETHEGPKASSNGDGTSDAPESSPVQGHSPGDADKESTGSS